MRKKDTEHIQKRTHIIQVILDDYEKGDSDWRTFMDGSVSGNRSIRITQALYDEIGRADLNKQVLELQKEGLLQDGRGEKGGWYIRGSELMKITYRLQDIRTFYAKDGRIPKYILYYEPLVKLQKELEELKEKCCGHTPWILSCIESMAQEVQKEKIPKICREEKRKNIYFKTLAGLDQMQEAMYMRVFSHRFLGNSKLFEEEIKSRIISDVRKWKADIDEDKEVIDDDSVLAEIGIETYHQELLLKGSLKFTLHGKEIDTGLWKYGTTLNADTMKHAEIAPIQTFKRVISVENKANFAAMPFMEDTLILFSHGFFSPKERHFLHKIWETVPKAAYFHSSDLDYGGLCIYTFIKDKIFPNVKPFLMDEATFRKYEHRAEKREEPYLMNLSGLEVPEEMLALKKCILQSKKTLEQESMLY